MLACFDETATIVFGTLCQLCAGDADLAVELLGETYTYLARLAGSSYGVDVDRRWLIDAAHSVYAARSATGRNEIGPVAALAPRDRVIVHLHDVEHRGPSEIALLLGVTIDDVERSLAKGRAAIAPAESGSSTVDTFRCGDVWFDDVMRAQVRARLGGPAAPREADDQQDTSTDDPAHALISRRTMVGAGAAASIAALIGLGVWFGSSSGDESSHGNELPEPPTTSSRSRTTTPTTTPATPPTMPTLAVDTTPTDETIVLGNDTTTVPTTPVVPETGFIIDPVPDGFLPAGGGIYESDAPRGWFQLWVSPDAEHSKGRWLAIDVGNADFALPQSYGMNTTRVELAGTTALLTTFTTGVLRLIAATSAGVRVEMRAFGIVIDDLAGAIAGLSVSPDNEPLFSVGTAEVLDGLDLRISRPADGYGMLGDLMATDRSAWYSTADGRNSVSVSATPQLPDDLFATALVSAPMTDPTAIELAPAGTVEVGGRQMILRSVDDDWDDGRSAFLQWHIGNYTVTASGSVELAVLVDVSSRVRLATPDEWDLQSRARPANSDSTATYGFGDTVSVGTTTTTAGGTWDVQIGTGGPDEDTPVTALIRHGNGMSIAPITPDPSHPVTMLMSLDVTVLVGIFEAPGAVTAIRVTIEGRDPVDVPLVRVGDSPEYGAAYAFSEIADFAVALVDAGGTVIQDLEI